MIEHNNPLLGKNFFNIPEKVGTDTPLEFILPSTNNCEYLTRFLSEPEGVAFKNGIRKVLDEFHHLMVKQGLINKTLSNPTENLKERLLTWAGDNKQQNDYLFPLFTQGIQFLKNIINYCEQHTPLSQAQNHSLTSLALGIQVCGPGSYTNICDTHLSLLSSNLDEKLMAKRKLIAEEVATRELEKLGASRVGWEIHYVNTILDFNAKEIGIQTINDPYSTEDDSVEIASKAVDFEKKFYSEINVKKIINYLSDSVNLDNELLIILELIKNDKVNQLSDHLASSLATIGIPNSQSLFSLFFNTIVDEDDNVTAELRSDAKKNLKIHLLHSLAESEHLKISDFKIELPNKAEMYLFSGSLSKLSHIKIINEHGNVVYYNARDYLDFLEKSNKKEEADEFKQKIRSLTKNNLDALKDKTRILNTLSELETLVNNGFIQKNDAHEALMENIETICSHENTQQSILIGKKLFDLLLKSNPNNITNPADYLLSLNDEALCKVLSIRIEKNENLFTHLLSSEFFFLPKILNRLNSFNDTQFSIFLSSKTYPHENSYTNLVNFLKYFTIDTPFPQSPDEISQSKAFIEKIKTSELDLNFYDILRLIEVAAMERNHLELRPLILPLISSFSYKIENKEFIQIVESVFLKKSRFFYIPYILLFFKKLPDDHLKKNFSDILNQLHKNPLSEILKHKDIICKVLDCFEPTMIISLLSNSITFHDNISTENTQLRTLPLFSILLNNNSTKSEPNPLFDIIKKFKSEDTFKLISIIPEDQSYRLVYLINCYSPEEIKTLCLDGLISTLHIKNNPYLISAVFRKINELPEAEIFSFLSSEKLKDDFKNGFIKPTELFLTTLEKLTPEHAKNIITHIIESGYKKKLPSKIVALAETENAFKEIELKINKFKVFLNEEYQYILNSNLSQKTIIDQGLNNTLENIIIPTECFSKHNETLLVNMQEQYNLCNTFLDKLKLNDMQPPTILDYQTHLKSLADCILEDENKQKIKNHIRDTRFKKCIAGIIIVLTGVLPALIALGVKALVSSKRHFTLFTSEGDKITNEILHHVKKLKP